jgi:hypothetical protein
MTFIIVPQSRERFIPTIVHHIRLLVRMDDKIYLSLSVIDYLTSSQPYYSIMIEQLEDKQLNVQSTVVVVD